MKKQIIKDLKKRKLNLVNDNRFFILKSLIKNSNLKNPVRWSASLKASDLSKTNFKHKIVKRCVLTGRKSKIHNNYRFSRLMFLRLVRNGCVSGLKKSTW
uniref:ribosomal protein S14 n=1 Tax=Hemiaulus sinensis TaxID=1003062 RepID=UPI002028AD07|nr:ribosomal protein S14 [Hemiaulus sinensis]QYB23211.1 ribosomal protein S14 [Hemiaulus sinensis]